MRQFETTIEGTLEQILEGLAPPRLGPGRIPIYRGHASRDWPIVPSLVREDLQRSGLPTWDDLEATFLIDFKQNARGDLQYDPQTELEWLSVAQHYGLPTRLTSWSENALIAVYFATEMTADRADGVVWFLLPGDPGLIVTQDYENVPQETRIYFPQNRDVEMKNQRTCFLTHPIPEHDTPPISFEDYFACGDERMHLYQIVIPHDSKAMIRKDLTRIGVDRRLLFPGLRGMVGHLREQIYVHTDSYEWIFDLPPKG